MRNGGYRIWRGARSYGPAAESPMDNRPLDFDTPTVHFDGPGGCARVEGAEVWDGTLEQPRRADVKTSDPSKVRCNKCEVFMKYEKASAP